jgi:superfamily II DNA or RNA helicase
VPLGEPTRYFQRHHAEVRIGWELVGEHGLRRAQLGAAWAIAAHDTASRAPALVVLPTGVGKTLLLCLAPYLMRARRVLVVTPGRLVRSQVATAFETLQDLKRTGVLPETVTAPRVAVVNHRATNTDWAAWRSASVVVGTPNVLSDGYPQVERLPQDMFDLVIFDEAHHLPARVWEAILQAVDARALLLTATPTRRDGKPLPGELIYSYPLSLAISDGVYAPISFRPVACGEHEDPDQVLATAAAARLADPVHREAGSRLLVRTGTQAQARALLDVYAELGVKLGLVLADTSPATVRQILREVTAGQKQGFVAVGAMSEGFDFPSLKIAAYHHPHRSLAPTLQFVGRLSRVGAEGVRGELLAIPEQVQGETAELYRQRRDWAELMPEIVEAAELREREIRRYVARAERTGPLDIPPRAFAPPRSARIYRLGDGEDPQLDVNPPRLGRADVVFRFHDPPTALVAFVTHRVISQRWARTRMLAVPEFELHLATWVREQNALFVGTESPPALDDMLKAFGVENTVRKLTARDLTRLVYAADPGTYFSVGLRAAQARRAKGATYDMTAGPAVQGALSYEERNSTTLGHVMARPKTGNRGTVGFSVNKSKLWEPENAGSLYEFREWAAERAGELDQPAPPGLPGLDVLLGEPFDSFDSEVLGASFDASIFIGELAILMGADQCDASMLEAIVRREDPETLELLITMAGSPVWRGVQTPFGAVTEIENAGIQMMIAGTGELVAMTRVLHDAPLAVYMTDGSTVIGDVLLPAREEVGVLPAEMVSVEDWETVDITHEVGDQATVQSRTRELASVDADWVISDHGSGELADVISLSASDPVRLRLYHCKASGGSVPDRRLGDLYEVLSQVVKTIPWVLAPGAMWSELARRLDKRDAFRVLHGNEQALRMRLAELARVSFSATEIQMIAVQPGVSIAQLAEWPAGRALLHAAAGWCSSESVRFRLLASA